MATKKLPSLDFENKISVTVTGGKSIFARDSKYLARVICCDHTDTCSFFKEGKCLKKFNTVGRNECPYGTVRLFEGYTPAARACNEWLHHFKSDEKYGQLNYVGLDRHFGVVGDYYFFDTTYVSYKENKSGEKKFDTAAGAYNSNIFIKKDELTLEWLNELLSYKPMAFFSYTELTKYRTEVVPFTLREMSSVAPDLYKALTEKYPEYAHKPPNYVGKRAYVATLKGGTVLNNLGDKYILSEDRKTLTCTDCRHNLFPFGAKSAKVVIEVTPDLICEIPDNDCVLPDTTLA